MATIYPGGNGYREAIDEGYDGTGSRQRIKRKGRTRQIVKDKLKKVIDELEDGIDTYTVEDAWFAKETKGLGDKALTEHKGLASTNVYPLPRVSADRARSNADSRLTLQLVGAASCRI